MDRIEEIRERSNDMCCTMTHADVGFLLSALTSEKGARETAEEVVREQEVCLEQNEAGLALACKQRDQALAERDDLRQLLQNFCHHASSTGVDQSDGPDKVFRCDCCGLRSDELRPCERDEDALNPEGKEEAEREREDAGIALESSEAGLALACKQRDEAINEVMLLKAILGRRSGVIIVEETQDALHPEGKEAEP
jgi:hypothetical protein